MYVDKYYKKLLKQSKPTVISMIFAKFLFGVGLGILLAEYIHGYNWELIGWSLILLAILLRIPSAYSVLLKD